MSFSLFKIPEPVKSRITIKDLLLAIFSGCLLFLAFPDYNLFLPEWIAFIPLFFAIEQKSPHQAYILGAVTGTVACTGGFYWVGIWAHIVLDVSFPLTWLIAAGHGLFAGHVFALSIFLYQWARKRLRIPELVLFPAIIVTVFSVFPLIFPFTLGDGQVPFSIAIQPIEFTGVYGLDFILAFVNILIYITIQLPGKRPKPVWLVGGFLLIFLWFGYGAVSLQKWTAEIASWPDKKIGLVQTNRKVSLDTPEPVKGFSRQYPLDLSLSQKLAEKGADLAVWPEGHFYGYTFWEEVRESFKKHIKQMHMPVIIFDTTLQTDPDNKRHYFNSSLLINRDGNLAAIYNKMKLVPFGEYTPLIGRIPFVKDILGDYLSNLTPGDKLVQFKVAGMNLIPKICYEPLFPELVAEAVNQNPTGSVIVVQSQDGWYGHSSQPGQHTASTVLRAVENRVPLIHVINNGPSSLIAPDGKIVFQTERYIRGDWVGLLPYSPEHGGSFFSRHPYLFINIIRILCLGLCLLAVYSTIRSKFNQ